MRATLLTMLILPGLYFAATPAATEESEAAAKDGEFTAPPGFRSKKRGKHILYCRREDVIGTRFQAEKCYDEAGVREMLRAQRDDQQKVDQMRRICGSLEACGGG